MSDPDHVIQRVCGLLKSERIEAQSAAALVLGELSVKDEAVVTALSAALRETASSALRSYLLEALEKIASPAILDDVLPLLEKEGEQREQALRVVAQLGAGIARKLGARLKGAAGPRRDALHLALARVRGAEGVRILVDSLLGGDGDAIEPILLPLRNELRAADAAEKKRVAARVAEFLGRSSARRSIPTQCAALRLLGFLEDAAVQPLLLKHSRASRPPQVRAAALLALRTTPRPKRGEERLVKELAPYLDDKDVGNVVRPVLQILHPTRFGTKHLPILEGLTRSSQTEVKRFALEKLREIDSARSAEILLRFVCNGDVAVRDVAGESLMLLPAARNAVYARLMREAEVERAWLLARILKPAAASLTGEQVSRLGARLIRLLDQENRVYEPLLYLLAQASAKEARVVLMKRAMRKKRSRRFEETAHTLRLLEKRDLCDAEVRFQLGVALLKQSPGRVHPDGREPDPAIDLLRELMSSGFPLFERLRKETVLTADELYRVGLEFVEPDAGEDSLGVQLLHLVMRKAPRSAVAKNAKGTLQYQGLK